ncbi:hypothetical protein DH2020_034767 [Rehmannia glutinosa]|uniref:Exostosin GT47 domain-containing protein n=1 Tax=Rehmannia glutinosa TaxID=99300 RepID=A0ABR0VAM6_REHGL
MASISSANKSSRFFSPHAHHNTIFTRTHQIAALALVVATFFLTRLFDQSLGPCSSSYRNSLSDANQYSAPDDVVGFGGYGTHLNLKIYVYDEDEIEGLKLLMYGREGKISAEACVKGQWGTQASDGESFSRIQLDPQLACKRLTGENSGVSTDDQVAMATNYTLSDREYYFLGGNRAWARVIAKILLSGGRNHIFVFPRYDVLVAGYGAYLRIDIENVFGWSWSSLVQVLGDVYKSFYNFDSGGDRTDKRDTSAFNTWKDIIIPGNIDDGMTAHKTRLVDPLPLSRRKYLANYLGRAQGKAGRLQLIDLAKQYPDKLESPELKFSGPDKLGRTEYFRHLGNAKFCLAPRGESSWTLRFYESFFVECVPVLLSDQVELPFQNVVDYSQISIKWPSTRIGTQLLDYLESIPDKTIEEMIARGRQVRCLWVYASETESCSAFSGILWELQKKVRKFHQSAETFWLHNGSIVNRNLVEFSKWKPPMPLP